MTGVLEGAALAYAGRGWRVVPSWHLGPDGSCACQRGADCTAAGKHPRVRGWPEEATVDPEKIRAWWRSWPDAHVSIATGRASGVFVVDIDPRGGGDASVEEYERLSVVGLPATLTAATGGGGRHLFYRYPVDGREVKTRAGWLPGVDVRGEGGQVVAPPSPHKSGMFYTWSSGWAEGPADAPGELLDALTWAVGEGGGERAELPGAGEILLGVGEGQRNEVLFRWACRLRRQLRDDRAAVEVLVLEAARRAQPPLGGDEALGIVASAFRQPHDDGVGGSGDWQVEAALRLAEAAGARAAGEHGGGGGSGGESGSEGPGAGEWEGADGYPLTDDGNALRFVRRWGSDVRWTEGRGWVVWDGSRWQRDTLLKAQGLARDTARRVSEEVLDADEGTGARRVAAWAHASQSSGRIDAMLRLSRDDVAEGDDDWDVDPWLLCVLNGTLDLRSGRLLPHRREDRITRLAPVRYEAGAGCGRWERFLETVLPDKEDREYVKRAAGYTLTGSTDAKALFVLYGTGGNGKSVLVEALRRMLGEYGRVTPKTIVMQTSGGDHPTELAGLAGARMVTLGDEVGRRDRMRASLLKSLTGGDQVTARFMRQDFFDFTPQLKLWMPCNYKPGLSDFGEAMTSRVKCIPFEVKVPEGERRDRDEVLGWFEEERSGILNWALEGLEAWRREGLVDTPRMKAELDAWVEDDDVIAQWMRERLTLERDWDGEGGKEIWSGAHEVYRDYELWVTLRGEDRGKVGMRTLAKELKARGVRPWRKGNESGWRVVVETDRGVTVGAGL